jgi:SSS family solute:Na+ symporter
VWYVLMSLAIFVYRTMAHQNKQGFNSAALTPHDFRMSGVLLEWRGYARMFMLFMLALGALAYLKHPAFAEQAAAPAGEISHIGDAYLKKQMTVPVALRYLLPIGIKGLFVSIMVMGLLAGDAGHLHSWGSIFVQDVIVPLQKRPMPPRTHIWVLRLAVTFVAVFAFTFSFFFTQTQYIRLWWDATAGIFVGGAGAAIIGGLYWRYGTTAAAWVAMVAGSTLAFTGILCNSPLWPSIAQNVVAKLGVTPPARFWLNGQEMTFWAAITAVVSYVTVSLITCREPYNLERMLHRGRYAVEGEKKATNLPWRQRFHPRNLLKFNEDFTLVDKLAAGGIFWWSLLLAFVTIGCAIANPFIKAWPKDFWPTYWFVIGVAVPVVIGVGTLFWFGIGGVIDLFAFFRALRTVKRDDRDDGRVVKDHNLADEPPKCAFPVGRPESATASRWI